MAHTVEIFTTVVSVMLLLGIFIPILNTALEQGSESPDVNAFERTVQGSSYLTIGLNLLALPLWTFGLNNWINLIILLPLRIMGMIALYYIIIPTKS